MERLISILKGEAKKSIESFGTSSLFYASALKSLKRDFGNNFVIAHLKLKTIFDKPQIKFNDREALRDFHQEIKCSITWLSSIGYDSCLYSTEYLTKAVQRLPQSLRQTFYRHSKELMERDSISLIQFEQWLAQRLKQFFNPIANVIANIEETQSKL